MKILLMCCYWACFLFSTTVLWGQSYIVMQVVGKVSRQLGQKMTTINQYDKLKTTEKLSFTDRNATLRVLLGTQVFAIKPPNTAVWNPITKSFVSTLKDALLATNIGKNSSKPMLLSLRAEPKRAEDFATEAEFKAFIAASDSVLQANPMLFYTKPFVIIDEWVGNVPKDIYVLDQKNYFFLTLSYNGQNLKIVLPSLTGNKFVLKQEFFTKIGIIDFALMKDVKWWYYNKDKEEFVQNFLPLFLSSKSLRQELLPLVQGLRKEGRMTPDIVDTLHQYIKTFYGNISKDIVSQWYDKKF
jgi:hypothetical protein